MFPRFLLFRAPKRVCHIQYKHFKSQTSQDSADSWLSSSFYVAFTRRCGCLFGRPFDKAFALLGTGTSCTMGTWCMLIVWLPLAQLAKPQTLCLDGTSWYIMVPCPVANKVMSNPMLGFRWIKWLVFAMRSSTGHPGSACRWGFRSYHGGRGADLWYFETSSRRSED